MSDRHRAKAEELLDQLIQTIEFDDDDNSVTTNSESVRIIEAALREAAKAPMGCVIDDTGAVRKVLGTLPITADGCVAGHGANVWPMFLIGSEDEGGKVQYAVVDSFDGGILVEGDEAIIGTCYSTRAAAESAREGGKP